MKILQKGSLARRQASRVEYAEKGARVVIAGESNLENLIKHVRTPVPNSKDLGLATLLKKYS